MIRKLALAAALLGTTAFAGTNVPVAPFTSIQLSGGGHVIVRSGAQQRVTLVKGDIKISRIVVNGDKLEISPCSGWSCPRHYDLEVEVMSPNIKGLSIHGGGGIDAQGSFAKQAVLDLQLHGGGDIQAGAIPAETVNASVFGGGDITTKPVTNLNAQVHGGGDITYIGHPPHVASQTFGGGSISSK